MNPKIKIVYLLTKGDVGGAQKYASDLAGHVDPRRYATKILRGGYEVRWLSNKVWPWALFLNDWLAIAELIRIFRSEQPDIIHLNSSKAGVVGAIAARIHRIICRLSAAPCRPIKVVFTAHGWVFNPTNHLTSPVRWLYIALHAFAARFQDMIICVSEYDYALARRYHIAPLQKLTTIHNGIDPAIPFLDRSIARDRLRHALPAAGGNLNTRRPWIGSIGRLVKEKDYKTYLRGAARIAVSTRHKKIEDRPLFFLIGEGPELEKLKAESRKLKVEDCFFFIPPGGEDAKFLKAFDIFIMSSIKEGLPYILLEAMTAGLCIVVTEAGGIPEIIKNHENGLMVAQKKPEQLAAAIEGILANPAIGKELGETAYAVAQRSFTITSMTQATEAVYSSLTHSL